MLGRLGNLPSAAHAAFGPGRTEHLVSLHHAAVGEAAVVFIRIAIPREVGRGASTTAGQGEPGRTIDIFFFDTHKPRNMVVF